MSFLIKYNISNLKIGNLLKITIFEIYWLTWAYPYYERFMFSSSEILETDINIILT